MKKIIGLLFCFMAHQTVFTQNNATAQTIAKQALEYANQFRSENGLKPLAWDQDIADAAQKHSNTMGTARQLSHNGFDQRIDNLKKSSRSAAENVFMTSNVNNVAQKAVESWKQSPGHRRNMLGNYSHAGLGFYQTSNGDWYGTFIFVSY